MPVPDFQSMMLPIIRVSSDDNEHSIHDFLRELTEVFSLSEQDLNEMLPSGKQTIFYNRVGWARTYLAKSILIRMTRRSHYKITARRKQVLQENPPRIDKNYLRRFPEFVEFRAGDSIHQSPAPSLELSDERVMEPRTPEELLDIAYQEIRDTLAVDLLNIVKQSTPIFFERLVVELLVKMGYGGSRQEAARAVGQTGDEGIDGIIDEDRLGLDAIYIQAKKWESVVGRPEIQRFVGALMGKRARKGIFITTSHFSSDAINYAATIDYKIVLIDGKKLADFMIDYDIGVAGVTAYQLKRDDTDYFANP